MSRIIVKGLPVYLDDAKLREHFVKRLINKNGNSRTAGELITDVKILKDRDGQSRRFAFIGYRSEEDAFDAVNYFDGSFINTSKIEVAMAKSFADPRVPKSMREQRREALKRLREKEERLLEDKQTKKLKTVHDKKKGHSIDAEVEKDQKLKEFIETMKPTSQVASWETPGLAGQNTEQESGAPGNSLLAQALALKEDEENKSDEEYVDFKKDDQNVEEPEEQMVGLGDYEAEQQDSVNDEKTDELAKDETVSDLDWFKQRRVRIRDGEQEPVKQDGKKPVEENEAQEEVVQAVIQEENKTDEDKAMEQICRTGRLFLRNILYSSTEQDFRQLFSPYGELEEVHIALDTRTGKSKGFAYVLFKNSKDAAEAYIALDKQIFQGRLLHILPADAKKDHRLDEFDLKNMPLKKQKELKRKATASKQSFAWNSLYMNQDAVLGSVAAKLGMQKSQLIDPENSSSAVKQALAEAHVIGDVRKYFESKGVDLTKFGQLKNADQRDNRVILVKNFPFGTTIEELGDLFLPFGKLERFLMPPAGTIAIIQYRDVTSARAAFTKLAYKRFKDGIIYLEMGPKDCFTRSAESDETLDSQSGEEPKDVKEIEPSSHDLMEAKDLSKTDEDTLDDSIDGPTVSIFIKNLNFSTNSQQLTEVFRPFTGFVVAQVKTKPDPKNKDKTLSMGFGFAEFRTKEQALAVISAVDGTVLNGHRLQLKISHRAGASSNTSKSSSKKSGKIIVKNLPFEATRKDIFELFSSFGHLKSVRVPKKFDKSARGFAFVEFLLPKEAENAMDQLQGVHLLGRRLVMQYAEQESEDAEDEIARMTKKVKKQAAIREIAAIKNRGGRRKLDLEDDGDDGMNGV